MGLFRKHDQAILKSFEQIIQEGKSQTESEFLDNLNKVIRLLEVDQTFSTNEKLKIYELLSQLSNCAPKDRTKYANRLIRKMR